MSNVRFPIPISSAFRLLASTLVLHVAFVGLLCAAEAGEPAKQAEVFELELHLVVHDRPDVTLDKAEETRWDGKPGPAQTVDAVCWPRNVLLDGRVVFERYSEGEAGGPGVYIFRAPRVMASLQAGAHTIWPGDHKFAVAEDGSITTDDPELIVEDKVLKMKCYPVTVRGHRARAAARKGAAEIETIPLPELTIRESTNVDQYEAVEAEYEKALADLEPGGKKPEFSAEILELLPLHGRFAPLTIYLPANTVGKGYTIHPLGFTFHVRPEGVVAGADGGRTLEGVAVRKHQIDIPLYSYPCSFTTAPRPSSGRLRRWRKAATSSFTPARSPSN